MRKTLINVISLLAVLSMLIASCAPAATKAPEATQVPTPAGPVTIRIFTNQTTSMDLPNSSLTTVIQDKFKIKFDWDITTTDCGSAKEKRNLEMASGDYADLIFLSDYCEKVSQTDLILYGKQGVFVPLNDLIDQYAPDIKAALDKDPAYKAMITAPDGKIYGLQGYVAGCYHCFYIQKMWINTTWLEKLGLTMPKTTEEFKAVLEAFKTKDPNGNGVADEIPLTAGIGQGDPITMLINAFIYDDMVTHLIVNDGKVDINANKAEWKEGLLYIRSLVEGGLLDPGAFTQNWEAVQKIGNNDPEILGVGGLFPWYLSAAAQNDYWAVGPLVGPKGVQYAQYADYNGGGAQFVLTNKASPEAQIAAIKMANWMYTEEGMYRMMGIEGTDWRKPVAGEVALDKNVPALYFPIPLAADEKPRNNIWEKIGVGYYPREWGMGWVQSLDTKTPEGFERKLAEATWLYDGKTPKEVFPHWAVWVDPTLADEVAMLKKNITDYINQNAAAFVTGSKSLEQDWDSYVKGLDDLNLKRYLEIMQQEYDAYKGK